MSYTKRHSILFYKYFVSYIIVIVTLLLIIGGMVYGNFIQIFQKEIESANISMLAQMRDTLDIRVQEMNRIAVQIAANAKLTPYQISNTDYNSFQSVEELQKYRGGNSFIDDIIIYYNRAGNDKMYAASGIYDLDMFFNYTHKYTDWGKNDFLKTLETMNKPVIRSLETVKRNNTADTNMVTYIYPLPIQSDKPYGVILFLIKAQAFEEITRNILQNYNGHAYISDERHHPIVSLTAGTIQSNSYQLLNAVDLQTLSAPVNSVTIENEPYSVVKLSSTINGWNYITFMPSKQFMMKVQNSRNMFTYTIIAVLVLGLMLSFGLASKNYKPLQSLVDLIRKQKQDDPLQRNINEITYISRIIQEVSSEREGLMFKLKSKTGMVKEYLLLSLLEGKSDYRDKLQDMMDTIDLKFENPYFAVLLFFIDDYDRFQKQNSTTLQDLFRFSIINVTEELSLEIGCGYGLDLINNRGTALLLNFNREGHDPSIKELAHKTKEFFKQYYKFTLTVSIGSTYSDLSMVHTSYVEANRASFYRFIRGKDRIICYQDIETEQKTNYQYPKQHEEQLVMAIKQGKGDDIEQILKNITRHIIKQSLSPELSNFIYLGIINALLKTLDEIEMNPMLEVEVESLFTQDCETIEILEHRIIQFCQKKCEHIANQKESKNVELSDQIISYVKEHYTNHSLSLEYLADTFHLSSSYITRFFKDQTGVPLMRYVDMLRMDKAKELLRNTNFNLRQIMEQVGYVDEANFIRKFKKNESITPIQYRNLVQDSQARK